MGGDDSRDEHFVRVLKQGIDAGLTLIDTAEAYGKGHSEELVGRAIKGKRQDLIVASKVSPDHLRPEEVIKAAEESLGRLQTDYIDLYQVHWPNPSIPIAETMEAMARLVQSGKIRYVGVSNYSLPELKEALTCVREIAAVQVEYNLFDRTIEEDILPFCKTHSISVLAYSPLCLGQIAYNSSILALLMDMAAKYGKHPSQIALKWMTTGNCVAAIPKASNFDHTRINADASDFDLTEEDYRKICLCKEEPVKVPTDNIKVNRNGLDKFVPSAEDPGCVDKPRSSHQTRSRHKSGRSVL